jgi:hypothetical protein
MNTLAIQDKLRSVHLKSHHNVWQYTRQLQLGNHPLLNNYHLYQKQLSQYCHRYSLFRPETFWPGA